MRCAAKNELSRARCSGILLVWQGVHRCHALALVHCGKKCLDLSPTAPDTWQSHASTPPSWPWQIRVATIQASHCSAVQSWSYGRSTCDGHPRTEKVHFISHPGHLFMVTPTFTLCVVESSSSPELSPGRHSFSSEVSCAASLSTLARLEHLVCWKSGQQRSHQSWPTCGKSHLQSLRCTWHKASLKLRQNGTLDSQISVRVSAISIPVLVLSNDIF